MRPAREVWPGPQSEFRERWRIAHALRTWRTGQQLVAQVAEHEQRDRYEQAVRRALGGLAATQSMTSLIRLYFDERRTVETLVAAACSGVDTPPDCPLVGALVEDAAFWRRLRQLVVGRAG